MSLSESCKEDHEHKSAPLILGRNLFLCLLSNTAMFVSHDYVIASWQYEGKVTLDNVSLSLSVSLALSLFHYLSLSHILYVDIIAHTYSHVANQR